MSAFNSILIREFLEAEFCGVSTVHGQRILDLGCGQAPYRGLYAGRFEQCLALEYHATAGADLRGDAARLPFQDATFDTVLLTEVIEHLPNPARAMAEIRRVMKPHGVLLITWPFNYMLHEVPADFTRFTEFGMQALAIDSGFQMERIVRRGNCFVVAAALAEFLVVGFLGLLGRIPLVGLPFRGLARLVQGLFTLLSRFLSFLGRSRPKNFVELPGTGLKGWSGQLSLWTLGYCARLRADDPGRA